MRLSGSVIPLGPSPLSLSLVPRIAVDMVLLSTYYYMFMHPILVSQYFLDKGYWFGGFVLN